MNSKDKDERAPLQKVFLQIIGTNETLLWGISVEERTRRMLSRLAEIMNDPGGADVALLVDAGYALDPQWLAMMLRRPGAVLTLAGAPIIACIRTGDGIDAAISAMTAGSLPGNLTVIKMEDNRSFYNAALRKREEPFMLRLTPETVGLAERASYIASYKGITDLLTKYLWPRFAFHLTRLAAALGMTPNMVTTIGAILCVVATICFWRGEYWTGMVSGLAFMVLDTVDGKLARCTITSSWWGNIFDHGLDIVHPPFWWWAWGVGLGAWGLALSAESFAAVMIAIIGGYVIQRIIEGAFMRRNGMMHIHVWQRFDSQFRLVTARRNPNMVILFFMTLAGRPDIGIIAVAWWTVLSCLVHAVRLLQAEIERARAGALRSWLEEAA